MAGSARCGAGERRGYRVGSLGPNAGRDASAATPAASARARGQRGDVAVREARVRRGSGAAGACPPRAAHSIDPRERLACEDSELDLRRGAARASARGKQGVTLEVIGAGFGRTGTLSLKTALERVGFVPCY